MLADTSAECKSFNSFVLLIGNNSSRLSRPVSAVSVAMWTSNNVVIVISCNTQHLVAATAFDIDGRVVHSLAFSYASLNV